MIVIGFAVGLCEVVGNAGVMGIGSAGPKVVDVLGEESVIDGSISDISVYIKSGGKTSVSKS